MDERLLAATRTPGDLVGFAVQLDPREFGDPRAPFPGHVFLDTGEVMTADVTLSDEAVEDIFQLAPDAIRDGAAEETICLWLVQGRLRGHHLHIEAADGFEIVSWSLSPAGAAMTLLGGTYFRVPGEPG